MEVINDFNPQAMIKHVEEQQEAMALWSENKKELFVQTFTERGDAARYILEQTAQEVLRFAQNRKFISQKHIDLFNERTHNRDRTAIPYKDGRIGGRGVDELRSLSTERAKAILSSLPSLKKAVEIIDPDVGKMIDKREDLLAKGDVLRQKLEDLPVEIRMSDMDENMTLGEFRKLVKDTAKKRKELLDQLNELGKEGLEIEDKINTRLYAGLPGLSDAVIRVAQEHMDRSKALDQMTRRVGEQVRFGDSKAALDLLKGFEKDEVAVSAEIKAEFSAAMAELKLVAANGGKLKALKEKKKG